MPGSKVFLAVITRRKGVNGNDQVTRDRWTRKVRNGVSFTFLSPFLLFSLADPGDASLAITTADHRHRRLPTTDVADCLPWLASGRFKPLLVASSSIRRDNCCVMMTVAVVLLADSTITMAVVVFFVLCGG